MGFILDASITLSWCLSDEQTPATNALLERLETEEAIVPALWSLEIGNILVSAQRKQRITYAKIIEFLSLLEPLNIRVDEETAARGFHEILSLSYSESLTTYDAAYLELAMRHGLPLATKDMQLSAVAKRLGVEVI